MILGFEMFGAFLFGAVTATLTIFFVGRHIMRKKLGGLLDLVPISPK